MYRTLIAAHLAVLSLTERTVESASRLLANAMSGRDRGQSTAEYALVLLGAASVALLFLAWAGKTSRIGRLFDSVLDSVRGEGLVTAVTSPRRIAPRAVAACTTEPVPPTHCAAEQRRRDRSVRRSRSDRGQATVELALGLPVVVLGALLVLQFALVAVGQIRAVHAAREGARAAAVGADHRAVERTVTGSSGLQPADVAVRVHTRGPDVEVEVDLRIHTDLPLIGPLLPDVTLRGRTVMRREM